MSIDKRLQKKEEGDYGCGSTCVSTIGGVGRDSIGGIGGIGGRGATLVSAKIGENNPEVVITS